MNKFVLLVLNCALLTTSLHAQTLKKLADYAGTPATSQVSFTLDGEIYVGLGEDEDDNYIKEMWKYSPQNDEWSQLADFGAEGRNEAIAFVVNGKAYVGMGAQRHPITLETEYFNDLYEYSKDNDSWIAMDTFPEKGRFDMVAMSFGDKAYIGTGRNEDGSTKNFYSFSNGQWGNEVVPQDAGFNIRYAASSAVLNGKGYVIAGLEESNFQLSDVYEFDPDTEMFTEKVFADGLVLPFYDAGTFTFDEEIYIAYGIKEFVSKYNPSTNVRFRVGDILGTGDDDRLDPVCENIGHVAYIGLGNALFPYEVFTDFYSYDFTTSTNEENNWIEVSPNPVQDRLFVSNLSGNVDLIGASGEWIGVRAIENGAVDVSDLKPGLYFLRGSEDETAEVIQFIKM